MRLTLTAASVLSTTLFMSAALAKPPAEVPADAKEAIAHAKQLSKAFRAVSRAVSPGVVSIETVARPAMRQRGMFMLGPMGQPQEVRGEGTGFVIAEDGYIVTNNHVVANAAQLRVVFGDGKQLPAQLVGTDRETDVAVLKVEATDLQPLAFGDSDAAEVGDWVIALGSPFGLNDTVTAGIISAKGREVGLSPLESYLQTDATINPGNSGGPLVDLEGKVVGINTAIESRSGGSDGIGFAIPSNMAKAAVESILSGSAPTRGYLGVQMQPLDRDMAASFGFDGQGVLISRVAPGSPAEAAGMQVGDIIVSVNNEITPTVSRLQRAIKLCKPGTTCPINVVRDGESKTLTAQLDDYATAMAQAGAPTQQVPRITLPSAVTPKAALRPQIELGMRVATIDPAVAKERGITDLDGILVTQVDAASIAARAGLRAGDIVRQMGTAPVTDPGQFESTVAQALAQGRSVRLLVEREGQTNFVLLRRT